MKAFITNSNSKRIVFQLDLSNIDINEEVFHIDFKWFSKYEIKSILAFKKLFKNPENFFQEYRKREAIDSKQYVFEEKAPAYHENPECKLILSSFRNYKLPKKIKEQGELKIIEFRNWFKENSDLMEDKMDFFLDRMKWKFDLDENPEVVNYRNSGVEIIEDLNLDELEQRIVEKIEKADKFYNSDERIKIILNNFGVNSFIYKGKKEPYQNHTEYNNEEIWDVLKTFDESFKQPISFLLKEYYKIKYNPHLEFDGNLLQQLGFEQCTLCQINDLMNNLLEDNIPSV